MLPAETRGASASAGCQVMRAGYEFTTHLQLQISIPRWVSLNCLRCNLVELSCPCTPCFYVDICSDTPPPSTVTFLSFSPPHLEMSPSMVSLVTSLSCPTVGILSLHFSGHWHRHPSGYCHTELEARPSTCMRMLALQFSILATYWLCDLGEVI